VDIIRRQQKKFLASAVLLILGDIAPYHTNNSERKERKIEE
jgi:hypothetical protein